MLNFSEKSARALFISICVSALLLLFGSAQGAGAQSKESWKLPDGVTRGKLPYCPSKKVWTNCFGAAKVPEGARYVGEWRNGVPNGQGTFMLPNGETYVGEFRDNYFEGRRTLKAADGRNYVGEFKGGMREGQGTETYLMALDILVNFATGNRMAWGH